MEVSLQFEMYAGFMLQCSVPLPHEAPSIQFMSGANQYPVTKAMPSSISRNMAFNCEFPGPMRKATSLPSWLMVVVNVKSLPLTSNFCEKVKGFLLSIVCWGPGPKLLPVLTSGSPHLWQAQSGCPP